ncbi:MAG TPA: hypothetical protein VMA73_20085 [Streptosporangiaceae bacterium]|nr:hypothetical protein [Streptosporangiaceae bacterium]
MTMWRVIAAGLSVVVAAAAGVVTALVTAHQSAGLWTALAALVAVGACLQVCLTVSERRRTDNLGTPNPRQRAPSDVVNVISGGVQHGPVLQGRDFTGLSFGPRSDAPPGLPADQDGA